MKNTFRILILLTFAFFFSCEEQGLFVRCSDCTTSEPEKTNLEIKLDFARYGFETIINVYEGNVEDSVIFRSFNTSSSYTTINVTLNKKYTVTATYYIPDDYYVVIDSSTPKVKYEKTRCDDPCFFVYDKVVDLRLKYTN